MNEAAAPSPAAGGARSYPLNGADIGAFRRDGSVCLRNVFAPGGVDGLREAVAWRMAHSGRWPMNVAGDKTKPPFFGNAFPLQWDAGR